jgi:PAS domain S-box-containing protein
MTLAKRLLLLVAVLLPTVIVVIISFLFGPSLGLLLSAVTASAISISVLWAITIAPRRHQHALETIEEAFEDDLEDEKHLLHSWQGANPPPGTMSAITLELCRRLVERRHQLKQAMLLATNALTSLTNPNPESQPLPLPAPDSPDVDDGRLLSSTYHIHSRNFQQLRLRDAAMTALLRDMPLAVVATDLELKIQYANAAAEELFGMQAARLQRIGLTKLFVDPPRELLNQDVTLPTGIGPKTFYLRLLENNLSNLVVWIRSAQGELIPATVAVRLGQHHVFQFLTLADAIPDVTNKMAKKVIQHEPEVVKKDPPTVPLKQLAS